MWKDLHKNRNYYGGSILNSHSISCKRHTRSPLYKIENISFEVSEWNRKRQSGIRWEKTPSKPLFKTVNDAPEACPKSKMYHLGFHWNQNSTVFLFRWTLKRLGIAGSSPINQELTPKTFNYTYNENVTQDAPHVHCEKRLTIFPSPDGMLPTLLALCGNNLIIPAQGEFG